MGWLKRWWGDDVAACGCRTMVLDAWADESRHMLGGISIRGLVERDASRLFLIDLHWARRDPLLIADILERAVGSVRDAVSMERYLDEVHRAAVETQVPRLAILGLHALCAAEMCRPAAAQQRGVHHRLFATRVAMAVRRLAPDHEMAATLAAGPATAAGLAHLLHTISPLALTLPERPSRVVASRWTDATTAQRGEPVAGLPAWVSDIGGERGGVILVPAWWGALSGRLPDEEDARR